MYDKTYNGNFSAGIGQGLRNSFRNGSALTRLIYINCGVFLILKILHVITVLTGMENSFYNNILEWVGVPADPGYLLSRPWTLFTYMFTQFSFLHLLFNMLWLYWFGNFFLDYFTGRQLTGVYILGGLAGALLYILVYNSFPYFSEAPTIGHPRLAFRLSSWAIGASASVMAVVFAVCTYLPQHRVYVFLIGPVKLIYLAIFTALIDLLSITSENAGGHIAHLGGALFGCLFIVFIRKNRDLTAVFMNSLNRISSRFQGRKKMRVKYKKKAADMNDREYNEYKKGKEQQINAILDKISKSGYDSLTREEKEMLFRG